MLVDCLYLCWCVSSKRGWLGVLIGVGLISGGMCGSFVLWWCFDLCVSPLVNRLDCGCCTSGRWMISG
ncbi:hypothetical protein Patl1_21065 [Pistacia atlantica]|uniref:Uncharacterized protein n=1 Tax=Pistacia atlantica TaxID=434234 RepID=A0ACC1BKG9_9ROSI|nr:hypothetical protein Patl1_21065 [Pistacia atlantica]